MNTDNRFIQSQTRNTMDSQNEAYANWYNRIIDSHMFSEFIPNDSFNPNSVIYRHIMSIGIRDSDTKVQDISAQLRNVFDALWSIKAAVFILVKHIDDQVNIFVGSCDDIELIENVYTSSIDGIQFEMGTDGVAIDYKWGQLFDQRLKYYGFFRGNPIVRECGNDKSTNSVLDSLIDGTFGRNWMLSISAIPLDFTSASDQFKLWQTFSTDASEYCNANFHTGSSIGSESMATTKQYVGATSFQELAERYCLVAQEAMQIGQWRVTTICYGYSTLDVRLTGGLYSAQLKTGIDSIKRPLPFEFFISNIRNYVEAPKPIVGKDGSDYLMTSHELAAVCSLPTKDIFGFQVKQVAHFDVSSTRDSGLSLGKIISNDKASPVDYYIDINSLNRHGLVIGLTGGGKTNTVKSLIFSIHYANLPFLIIEPAKKEYYELYRMGITELQIYSVGSGEQNSLTINPFECTEGIPLQTHIDAVFAAFKASFIMYTPMPYVLETAIYEIYADYGWDINTGVNRFGRNMYPTLDDLYYKIRPVVIKMGYDSRMQNDLIGSLKARINSLRIGSKGKALNVSKSMPIEELLTGEVIIELDDVGDEEAKAFIISLILMRIQECRKSDVINTKITKKGANLQRELQHLLVIEEAHRLLRNIPAGTGENADPRGAAVEYFCNMLAEIRSKGQGFLVIDQIPSKLAPDLIKNTNLKLVHRTVDSEDRLLIGGAMHMTDEQIDYLSCLRQGVAAVYSEGDNRPKLVQMYFADQLLSHSPTRDYTREQIIHACLINNSIHRDSYAMRNQSIINRICAHCPYASECIAEEGYIFEKIKRLFSTAQTGIIFSNIQRINKSREIIEWVQNDYIKQIHSITNGSTDLDYTRRCIYALWVERYRDGITYDDMSMIISDFTEFLQRIL